jgi:hypothetical protein
MPKWRQWETTSEADWTLALERESVVSEYEAEAIGQASIAVAAAAAPAFCIGSALPHTKALALHSVSSHNEFLQTI